MLSPPTVTGLAPDQRARGRRHPGDDHRNQLHRRHGGRLRHDGGDESVPWSTTRRSRPTARRAPGVVNVTVTTPSGTSAVSPADEFTYTAPARPTVTGVSPTGGPTVGGTLVTITGTSFTGATAVDFGTTAATNVTVVNDTTITADSPAGTGTVDVTVTTPGGTSATSAADQFTYVAAPTVTGLSPTSGSDAGGTPVTITGTNLHRRHGGRLRHDGGDEIHRGQRHARSRPTARRAPAPWT